MVSVLKSFGLRLIIVGVGLVLLVSTLASSETALTPPAAALSGSFIQLTASHGDWDTYDWEELFSCFRRLGLTEIVVQWTVYDQVGFFESKNYEGVPNPPLETILRLADESGINVFIGLVHDSRYWDKIRLDLPQVSGYLNRLSRRCMAAANELVPRVERHPSFQGWYIAQEIDDINWQRSPEREVLFNFLRGLSENLHKLTAGRAVTLSAFSNAATDPVAFEEFWKSLLKAADIDIIFLQDGVGANKLTLDELPFYFAAMERAVKAESRSMQVVVEIFNQRGGPSLDDGEFRAEPASLVRIKQQIQVARLYSPAIMAFSVPDYMSPLGGPLAGQLYEKYLADLGNNH